MAVIGTADALLAEAAGETREAGKRWASLRSEFPDVGPGPYGAHPDWSRAASEIGAGIEDMAARIAAGDPAAARTACGGNCGRFTVLNEAVGLALSPDALFRFRQVAKPLAELMAKGDTLGLRAALPRLAQLRDQALLSPATRPAGVTDRAAAEVKFSRQVDLFIEGVGSGADATTVYASMMKALESVYDAVL